MSQPMPDRPLHELHDAFLARWEEALRKAAPVALATLQRTASDPTVPARTRRAAERELRKAIRALRRAGFDAGEGEG